MSGLPGVFVASYVLLWVCVIVLALAVLALLRQVGVLHARLRPMGVHFAGEGLERGAQAPPAFPYDTPLTLVAFTAPDCTICAGLRPGLRALAGQYRELTVHVIDHDPSTAPTFDSFRVRSTPYMVAVDDRGIVRARGVANTLEQVEVMIDEVLHEDAGRPGDPAGPGS